MTAVLQRVENGLIAALALVATIVIAPAWWWVPLAAFVFFDLSMLGYLHSPARGARWYNAFHTYIGPAVLGIVAVLSHGSALSFWTGIAALTWAFHIGGDRALGYGLKLPDAFTHTHLGWIGKDSARNAS